MTHLRMHSHDRVYHSELTGYITAAINASRVANAEIRIWQDYPGFTVVFADGAELPFPFRNRDEFERFRNNHLADVEALQ